MISLEQKTPQTDTHAHHHTSSRTKSRRQRYSESYSLSQKPLETIETLANKKTLPTLNLPQNIENERPLSKRNSIAISPTKKTWTEGSKGTFDRMNTLAQTLSKLTDKQAVALAAKDIFWAQNLENTTYEGRKHTLLEILKMINTFAERTFTDIETERKIIVVTQKVLNYLAEKKWSSAILGKSSETKKELKLTKEAIAKKELLLLKADHEASIRLFGLLFQGEIQDVDLNDRMTLTDLSLVFTRLLTPVQLFQRVMHLLKTQIFSPGDQKRLLQFCTECLQNAINHPDEEIESLLKKIDVHLKSVLHDAYQKIILPSKNTNIPVKVEPLSKQDLEDWHNLTEGGNWSTETVQSFANSIVHKTSCGFTGVSMGEILSGSLSKRNVCPMFNQFADSINHFSTLVAQDILLAETENKRRNVIEFYIAVINHCMFLGDFASALALQLGFVLSPVSRLTKTWEGLSKKSEKEVKRLGDIFSPCSNWQSLKSEMQSFKGDFLIQPPFLFSQYVTFIDEASDRNENNLINQAKLSLLARAVLAPFLKMKGDLLNRNASERNPLIDRLLETLGETLMSGESLHELSLQRESSK
jgi:hypothetical protein